MNFLDASIEESQGNMILTGQGFSLHCDAATQAKLHRGNEKQVVLGVRPCDLDFDLNAAASSAIDIDVVVSEYIGAQSVLIGDCAGQKVMVEVKSDTPIALGEKLRFRLNLDDVHFFRVSDDQALV